MTDRSRMYAHIYFDLKADQLAIAVYSIAKIPNFSGKLPDELKEIYGASKAFDVFTGTLKDHISPDELQSGKAFSHSKIEDKLKLLNIFGKQFNPKSRVTVDLDSEKFWEEFLKERYPNLSSKFEELSEEGKKKALKQVRQENFLGKLEKAESEEDLQNILIEIYNDLARTLYPRTGGREYAGSTYEFPIPPTFLASKDLDMVYYPGYRGAQYMRVQPESAKYIHPVDKEKGQSLDEEKWHSILIVDTKVHTNNIPLKGNYDIVELDTITNGLALLFYDKLKAYGNRNLTFLNFQSAANPLIKVAKQRLEKLVAIKHASLARFAKQEGDLVGVWVDLANGQIFDSKSELLASKQQKEEKMLAAKKIVKILRSSRKESK